MKRYILIGLVSLCAAALFAQAQGTGQNTQAAEIGEPDASQLGIFEAQQKLKEVSVDKFEYEGFWLSTMSTDEGYATSRLFDGAPMAKQPIPEEEGLEIADRYVLGTRIDFLRRGYSSFFIYPSRPLPIEGITKTVSVWVAGRNFNHELNLLIEDAFGNYFELYVGKLNFQGWKKMVVAIPPQAADGIHGIVQRNYHYNNMMGIRITGFRIDCDPMEAYGSYYIYFDDLRAVTDLFAEDIRDADDMSDMW
ncbi:MAG: flagellar filament outer layer protein FlaA [Treponema sp.]|jgi:hypothetical protein|nr:flagellar filament outer layer protein FlaA [Treponema sp.]